MFVRVQKYPPLPSAILSHANEIDALFSGLLGNLNSRNGFDLNVDIAEGENSTVVLAEVPGVLKEDVKISLHENILTLSGERKFAPRPEGSKEIVNEVRIGTFTRSMRVPHQVDLNAVTADLANGMLKVTLPKAEEAKPRTITIK